MVMHADAATEALRGGSVDDLVVGLKTCLRDHAGSFDEREMMLDFAPFHDAAARLGARPEEVFDLAALNRARREAARPGDASRPPRKLWHASGGSAGW